MQYDDLSFGAKGSQDGAATGQESPWPGPFAHSRLLRFPQLLLDIAGFRGFRGLGFRGLGVWGV